MMAYRLYPLFIFFIISLDEIKGVFAELDTIPLNLIECYTDDIVLLPMSTTSLIDIIRKIETSKYFIMDMRMLTNSLINRFWRDGIERDPDVISVPEKGTAYRTTGFQSYKYKLLYSQLIPNSGNYFPDNILSLEERCTLHFMLSSSVDVWERGDESDVCYDLIEQKQIYSQEMSGAKKSSCPIEKGIILTEEFGSVSPSHVLGAIAATLQPMNVKQEMLLSNIKSKSKSNVDKYYNKTVNNVWASTISGDLAEVLVFQTPVSKEIHLGPKSIWNDTEIPVNCYMKTDYATVFYGFWQFTDAELLGAIDGLILADEVINFSQLLNSLKLSQLLEMYYTNQGGNFPGQTRACSRKDYFFGSLLGKADIIVDQTLSFAEVLAANAPHYFTDNIFIEQQIGKVYSAFKSYSSELLLTLNKPCQMKNRYRPKLNLFVMFDSTWNIYETLQVLMHIGKVIDVSYYGSNITVINGVKGLILADSANTVGDMYLSWQKAHVESKVVDSTDLHRGFLTVKSSVENSEDPVGPVGCVTLVLAASTAINDLTYSFISSSVQSIKNLNPDMKFIYVTSTSNSRSFVKLTSLPNSQNDHIITLDGKNKYNLYKQLDILEEVPRSLEPRSCNNASQHFEDFSVEEYISPDTTQIYRIHPMFLCSARDTIRVTITNNNYGHLEVCIMRAQVDKLENMECHTASVFEEIKFTISSICSSKIVTNSKQGWDNACKPVFIRVNTKRSLSRCAETGCRFPDDVRFSIAVSGLQCKSYPITCGAVYNTKSFLFLTVLSVIFQFLLY